MQQPSQAAQKEGREKIRVSAESVGSGGVCACPLLLMASHKNRAGKRKGTGMMQRSRGGGEVSWALGVGQPVPSD